MKLYETLSLFGIKIMKIVFLPKSTERCIDTLWLSYNSLLNLNMTDPIDKKLNEKRDNLDAMLDEADSSSVLPTNESQDDEDAIDRLLMNADFDVDDALIQAEANKDVDELDDFLSFDDFGANFNEPKMVRQDSPGTAAVETEQSEQAVGSSAFTQSNEQEGDEDALDRLLMSVEFDADGAPVQSNSDVHEALEQAEEPSSAVIEDEFDDSFGLSDDFDESDMIQKDELEGPAPEDLIAPSLVEEPSMEVDAVVTETPDDFSDFSDFIESDIMSLAGSGESGPTTEDSSSDDVADLSDEVDDFSGVDFDESDLIRDDEVETSADLVVPNEQFSDDNDNLFPDTGLDTKDALVQADEKTEALDDAVAALPDEVDDFSGYGDDFDASGLIQDDENSFANLFADADSDSEGALEQTGGKKDAMGDDSDLSKIDNFFQLDEVSDDFSKEMEATQLAGTDKLSTEEDDFLLPDFDITADTEISEIGSDDAGIQEDEFADAFGDTDFLNEDATMPAFEPELQSSGNEAVAESKPKQTADTVIDDTGDVILSPFGFEREDIKKQLEDAENKVKKAKIFGYVALGFGVVALSAAAALGVMTHSAKTEVSKLTEDVSALEADLAKIVANNPNAEINAMVNSVVQLNQQVYGFITELKGNPQFPVDLLNTKVPDIAVKQDRVSKALDMLQAKIGDSEEKWSLASSDVEPAKVEVEPAPAPVKDGNVQEHEPTKKEGVAHEHAPIKEKAMHGTAPAKAEVIPEAVPAKVKAKPETVTAKPAYATKSVIKQDARRVIKQEVDGKWGVNLIAFKQEWFAKSKAAEFARLGVIAEVVPVREKNVTMYRLRAGGFKSKAEAVSNTAKLKKALNLDSVWVSDN
ncbi:SPOR domain-containing protein [Methylobacter svalbardensis]|uniref:SPOR domain-containing protein n=1 Tax=Methylobacter svalbardensis TaxID=3080016 RepID=UPI0030ECEE62